MKSPLRILSLEDDPHDAELIRDLLEADGIPCEMVRVDTEPSFTAQLEHGNFDLILADYTLPSFDGLSALKLAKQRCPEVPFIFVSGTLGEEVAIEALKVGATDYVLKTRLSRLVPSLQRALREAGERSERKRAQEALLRSERYLAEAQKLTHSASWAFDPAGNRLVHWSEEHYRVFGFDPAQGMPSAEAFYARIHPDDRTTVATAFRAISAERTSFDINYRIVLPDGTSKHIRSIGAPIVDDARGVVECVGTVMDVTEQHNAQAALETAFAEIETLKDQLFNENVALRQEIVEVSMFEEIVGTSESLRRVLVHLKKVAATDSTVLILGETGTGKELIARAIHKRSNRANRPFIRVNCAAIPSSLIASELFGHEKGAFTGALQRRLGRFEAANGGTIFLDEIGELPAETQVALLRVLQERELERVGSNVPIPVDVRVLAATNRNLKAAVAAGTFRQDLFYRLNVFPIEIPPLRERLEDIPPLVEYFIERYSARAAKKFTSISRRSLEVFQRYDWPGNIRELQNVVERAVILCEGDTFTVDESWFTPETARQTRSLLPLPSGVADRERELIEAALAESEGKVAGPSGAAAKLGIPRQTLDSKIANLGIDKRQFKARQAD